MRRGLIHILLLLTSLWLGGGMGIGRAAEFGQLDASFAPELAPVPGELGGLANAPAGKYLVWGQYHRAGSARRINLARMNADGTLDETFNAGLSALSSISKVSVQTDGAMLVLGNLILADGTVLPNIVRFLPTGALDESFQLPENIGLIYSFTLIPASQKIMLSGLLLPTNNIGSTVLLRLESNGGIDASFNSAVKRGNFTLIQPLNEGKLLVEGFLSLSAGPDSSSLPLGAANVPGASLSPPRPLAVSLSTPSIRRKQLWRLNENGSVDDTFSNVAIPEYSLTPGPQDVIYHGEDTLEDPSRIKLQRFSASGELDTTFAPVFDSNLIFSSVMPLKNGKLLVQAMRVSPDQDLATVFLRLAHDGALEAVFGVPWAFYAFAGDWMEQPGDGSVLFISHIQSFALPADRLVKLDADGTIHTGLASPFQKFEKTTPLPQNTGKIYLQYSRFDGLKIPSLSRFEKNGEVDEGFSPPLADTHVIRSPVVLNGGDIIIEASPFGVYESSLVRLTPTGQTVRELTSGWLYFSAHLTRNWVAFPDGKLALARRTGFGSDAESSTPYLRLITEEFQPHLDLFPAPDEDYFPDVDLRITADGKLLATGVGYSADDSGFYTEYHLEKFFSDGQRDSSFEFPVHPEPYFSPHITDNIGRIYTYRETTLGMRRNGGSVSENDLPVEPTSPPLQRFWGDGVLDSSFNPQLTSNSSVDAVWPQKDGRILIAGRFYSADGKKISTLMRLLPDGSPDETFRLPAGDVVSISTIAVEADGNILVGGAFDQIGGVERPGLARLKSIEQPQMRNITYTEGGLKVKLDGNAGRSWLIQASDNLENWTTVATITTGMETETVDVPAPGSGSKFYRALLAP